VSSTTTFRIFIDGIAINWRCEVCSARPFIARTSPRPTYLLEHQQQDERDVADLVLDGWIVDA